MLSKIQEIFQNAIEGKLRVQSRISEVLQDQIIQYIKEMENKRTKEALELVREDVRVAHFPVVDWARTLHRPPTASPVILGTGVLWVSTGTHPCGSPSRQDDGETRAPALHTLDDVLRFRGDEEYRAVLLHPSSTCSCPRSGRS